MAALASIANLFLFLMTLFLLTGCGASMDLVLQKKDEGIDPIDKRLFLKESYETTEGTINLADLRDKPIVFMFSEETCSTCIEKTENFRDSLKNKKIEPDKVHLITLLVGSIKEDAEDWKRRWKAPWTVAYTLSSEEFKLYCGGTTTPCTIAQTPEDGIVYKHIGLTKREELETLTGAWE